ncbi:ribonuclease H-like domain-containing protein [Eubacterium sp.]|uniref:ribonuclease H-like domain-containing protein n=1 Tax=Eubacterium sp. TaxID=142586 RepID=UPI0025E0D380|nr:ribonuclease H-like domain-containing protein [Eubacterium sp.]MCR5629157.1 ribonuclease H-like domain-containing protein [Eubacterium sp.]
MLIYDQIIESTNINTTIYNGFNYNETFFLDIETTGLSPKNSLIYLIGILYFDKEWHLKQWFLDNAGDEENMLKDFTSFLTKSNLKNVIHFNGTTFDCKFIDDHCKIYGIDFSFAYINQIDLYKIFNKYKNILSLDSLKQKSIEFAYGINRNDKLSGKELISKYKEYLLNKKAGNAEQLLLHNFEDIINLPVLSSICSLDDLYNNKYSIKDLEIAEGSKKAKIILTIKNILPKFFKGNDYFNITPASNKDISINSKIKNSDEDMEINYNLTFGNIEETSLKFFYKDYKNYFYLPNEDMAIHKSMAAFMDKDKKVKATKDNCYTKIKDSFISIPDKPTLSKKYTTDDNSFFEDIKIFKDDNNKSYIRLSELNNKKFLFSFINYILK